MFCHTSFNGLPLTLILSPTRGEETKCVPLSRFKGEGVPAVACSLAKAGQGEGSFSHPAHHHIKSVAALEAIHPVRGQLAIADA